jgi:hypothetical protein
MERAGPSDSTRATLDVLDGDEVQLRGPPRRVGRKVTGAGGSRSRPENEPRRERARIGEARCAHRRPMGGGRAEAEPPPAARARWSPSNETEDDGDERQDQRQPEQQLRRIRPRSPEPQIRPDRNEPAQLPTREHESAEPRPHPTGNDVTSTLLRPEPESVRQKPTTSKRAGSDRDLRRCGSEGSLSAREWAAARAIDAVPIAMFRERNAPRFE